MLRIASPIFTTLVPQLRKFATTAVANKAHNAHASYSPMQAIQSVRNSAVAKFDETFEVSANLNIDPKKTNQVVRGMLILPHGTGKHPKIAVFADGKYAEDAKDAGADIVGLDDLISDVKNGKINFDVAITAPRYVPRLAPIARILGPKKLMPSNRNGTVSADIPQAIKDAMRGNTEIKPDKSAAVHVGLGKLTFTDAQLLDNLKEFIIQLSSIKPPTVKNFIKSVSVCSTMGPSFSLDMRFITPGRYFFNEELADSSVVIPEKVVKLSTRKRHALKAEEEKSRQGEVKEETKKSGKKHMKKATETKEEPSAAPEQAQQAQQAQQVQQAQQEQHEQQEQHVVDNKKKAQKPMKGKKADKKQETKAE